MGSNELLKQLNILKEIKPGGGWKAENREFLRKQIYGSRAEEKGRRPALFVWARLLAQSVSQPAGAVVLIILFMFGSGIVGWQASQGTKPGDSLYIAKILSERTQLALTFNEKEKARLGIEFAGNRAEELDRVLAEDNGEQEEKVEELVNKFKKEISAVKTRVKKISGKTAPVAVKPEPTVTPTETGTTTEGEETSVFSANLGKDDKGISLSEPETMPAEETTKAQAETATATEETAVPAAATTTATSTLAEIETTTAPSPTDLLKEAEASLNSDNYDNTIIKLDEAVTAIDSLDNNTLEVDESATTTESGATGAGSGIDEGTVLGEMATGTIDEIDIDESATTTE